MPMFEYKCENCGYHFDRMVARWDSPVRCPLCDGKVQKLMSMFSVGGAHGETNRLPPGPGPKMCTKC